MGVVRSATGDYTLGYLLLAATAATATAFTWFIVKRAGGSEPIEP